ncbi:MAG TPA: gluconate 2-dehydrogenase subunit 3 family protein [Steroidobacteraceae bacterium]|jgi:hypothetical protein
MDRRTTLKWILAASVAMQTRIASAAPADTRAAGGYGTDPKLLEAYPPGKLWPLTLSAAERKIATLLADTIIPADAVSPSASSVGVVDFIDEWVSAPYARQIADRRHIREGFRWLDQEAKRRFSRSFAALDSHQVQVICDDICYLPRAKPRFAKGAAFFARYRDLTAGAFYTTPVGRKDVQYIGNTPSANFDGPPLEVLKKVGLA